MDLSSVLLTNFAIPVMYDSRPAVNVPMQGCTLYHDQNSIVVVADIRPVAGNVNMGLQIGRFWPDGRRHADGFIEHVQIDTSSKIWLPDDLRAAAARMVYPVPPAYAQFCYVILQSVEVPRVAVD